MNQPLKQALIPSAIRGRDPDGQSGIRLSSEFTESIQDPAAGVDDILLILVPLQKEKPRKILGKKLAEFRNRHDQEIPDVTSATGEVRSKITALGIQILRQRPHINPLALQHQNNNRWKMS